MVHVYASKGPLAGSKVDIPEDQVDAATAEGGWAIKIEPGNQLVADPGAPYDEKWVIPGYKSEDLEPFTAKGRERTADMKGEGGKPTSQSERGGQQNAGSSRTSGVRTAGKGEDNDD